MRYRGRYATLLKQALRDDPNKGCEGDYSDVFTVVLLAQNKALLGSETIRAD